MSTKEGTGVVLEVSVGYRAKHLYCSAVMQTERQLGRLKTRFSTRSKRKTGENVATSCQKNGLQHCSFPGFPYMEIMATSTIS